MFIATYINHIRNPKFSYNQDTQYYIIFFRLENGKSALTYPCSKYKNFERWKKVMAAEKGTKFSGLFFKEGYKGIIDGDSEPEEIGQEQLFSKQLELITQ